MTINYRLAYLRKEADNNHVPFFFIKGGEEEISSIAERLIKSFMDRGYDPLEIIDIFSGIFSRDQVRRFIGFHMGMKKLKDLESKKES
mgnify:FL=1